MACILIVEDYPDVRDFLMRLLRHAGYEVIDADDGTAAMILAQQHLPDLIVMDLVLPRVNGLKAIAQLKADQRTKHIPVLALTARVYPDNELLAREAGCAAFMTKPFDIGTFLAQVKLLLDKSYSVGDTDQPR